MRRAFAGLFLASTILGATWSTLATLPGLPGEVLTGNLYAVAQGSGALSINDALVDGLRQQPWADLVGPEIFAFGMLHDDPVIVRGAEPGIFLSMEGGTWIEARPSEGRSAYAGEGLASRLSLAVGDDLVLLGSTIPRLEIVRIRGIFSTRGLANDELIVEHTTGRSLSGLVEGAYHSIRVKTDDPSALVSFLEVGGVSAHVTGPGLPRVDIHSDPPPQDDRISNLILRGGTGTIPVDSVSSAISQASNSIRVVAVGLAGLIALLVALGIHGVQTRVFADRRAQVGTLRAIGARGTWLLTRALREIVPVALVAGVAGAVTGFALDALLGPATSVVLFGHRVPLAFDPAVFVLVPVFIVGIAAVSAGLLLRSVQTARPYESLREAGASSEPIPALEVVLRG